MSIEIGQIFGKLTIVEQKTAKGKSIKQYVCRCSCGAVTAAHSSALLKGAKLSCGCYRKEVHKRTFLKHGLCRSKIYDVWVQIVGRCKNLKHPRYADYGGRGIEVCDAWLNFENFYADVGEPPKGMQLDRIENNKGYCKDNVHWTTSKTNNRNRRNTLKVEYMGKLIPVGEVAEITGLTYEIIRSRHRSGKGITAEFCVQRKRQL